MSKTYNSKKEYNKLFNKMVARNVEVGINLGYRTAEEICNDPDWDGHWNVERSALDVGYRNIKGSIGSMEFYTFARHPKGTKGKGLAKGLNGRTRNWRQRFCEMHNRSSRMRLWKHTEKKSRRNQQKQEAISIIYEDLHDL